jgi:hypothetical protein
MKFFFAAVFCSFAFTAGAQLSGNFETGNLDGWTQTPAGRWSATSITGTLSGHFSLRHTPGTASSGNYRDRISVPVESFSLTEGHTVWRFLMRYNYNPTAANKWAILLMSDTDATHWSARGDCNGYAVGVNLPDLTANKILCLYEVRDGTYNEIINTGINWNTDVGTSSTATVAIEIRRSAGGEWRFYWAKTGNFETLQYVGAATSEQYTAVNYFGACTEYTSSSSGGQKLWLDDITIVSSAFPAKISAAAQEGRHRIRVSFTQNLDAATVGEVTSYTLTCASATLTPALAEAINEKEVLLTFENPLPRGNAMLSVEKLLDENNNEVTGETAVTVFYLLYGDIIINEIMSAPAPSAGLPEVHYIELYNRLELPVPVNGWKMEYNATAGNIGAATVPPHGYLILCTAPAVEDMRVFGNATGVSYISSLTKAGKTLQLKNSEGQLLSRVTYSDRWFNDDDKRAGGWSLEKIDANNLSESAANWAAGTDARGGTPGAENSIHAVNPDTEAPFVTSLEMLDGQTLSLTFNELFDTTKALHTLCYTLSNGAGQPQQVDISPDNPQQLLLRFASSFVQGEVYGLTVSAPFCDLAGNVPEEITCSFGNLFLPGNDDIVINEVLFNPPTSGADFVEIYNRSEKIFDLRQVKLANRDKNKEVAAVRNISQQYYLRPQEYAVFTTGPEAVRQFYSVLFPEKVVVLKDLPSYPNESGCVVLLNENDEIIDEFLYAESMHSGFISNPKGISLERVNPGRPTNERANWQSAAQDAGFATPTYRNSQYNTREEHAPGVFNLPYAVFSPDGDGYNDVLYIDYNAGAAGYVANITIYDTQGRLVKEVEKKTLLGASGRFAWDGSRYDNHKAGIGMYIIFIEYFDLNGSVTHLKKPCALAGR